MSLAIEGQLPLIVCIATGAYVYLSIYTVSRSLDDVAFIVEDISISHKCN